MTSARKPPVAGELHVWRVELKRTDPRGGARGALAAVLADYLGPAAKAAMTADDNGKPRLAWEPGRLSFNLSHTKGLALVAIAPGGTPVGIDVEQLRPRRDLVRLAARWLPADDATLVSTAAAAEREAVFYAAWTRHEARVKCSGTGIAGPPPAPSVVARTLPIDAGYAAAVAVDAVAAGTADPRVTMRRWEP